MFITKKHISRRTILKGAGVNLALPFLSAMVPASTALAQTAANPSNAHAARLRWRGISPVWARRSSGTGRSSAA